MISFRVEVAYLYEGKTAKVSWTIQAQDMLDAMQKAWDESAQKSQGTPLCVVGVYDTRFMIGGVGIALQVA